MFERILIAADGSAASERAMAQAIDLAARDRSELVALTVVPRTAMHYFDGVSVPAAESLAFAEAGAMRHAQAALDAHVALADASQVKLSTQTVVSDTVADVIVNASRQYGSDLIVMGASQQGLFSRFLHGSETQHVLDASGVPVLVVH